MDEATVKRIVWVAVAALAAAAIMNNLDPLGEVDYDEVGKGAGAVADAVLSQAELRF